MLLKAGKKEVQDNICRSGDIHSSSVASTLIQLRAFDIPPATASGSSCPADHDKGISLFCVSLVGIEMSVCGVLLDALYRAYDSTVTGVEIHRTFKRNNHQRAHRCRFRDCVALVAYLRQHSEGKATFSLEHLHFDSAEVGISKIDFASAASASKDQ